MNSQKHSRRAVHPPWRALFAGGLFVLLSLGPLVVAANAATVCVGPAATGNGSGSDWNNQKAWSATPARGDVWYLGGGSYAGKSFNTPNSGTTLITIKKAIGIDHGTDTGWNSALAGQTVFSFQVTFLTSNWVFDGQTGGGPGNWTTGFGFKFIMVDGQDAALFVGQYGNYTGVLSIFNVTIRHYEVVGVGHLNTFTANGGGNGNGVTLWGPDGVTVSHGYIHDTSRGAFFLSGSNFIIENNRTDKYASSQFGGGHTGVAIIYDFARGVGDVTFRNNFVTYVGSTGGIVWDNKSNHNAALRIYGNIFYRPPGVIWDGFNGVIGAWQGGNGEDSYNIKAFVNTFVNVNTGDGSTQPPLPPFSTDFGNNEARDNLFVSCSQLDFSRFAHNHNHFINSGGTFAEANGTSGTANPFVGGLDFHLTANTVAGANLGSPYNTDPDGVARSTWTRGAYEFVASGPVQPPVVNSGLTASGAVGSAFSYSITATNSPTSFNATGLPAGLSVNTSTGAITGTPTAAGTTSVSISATNSAGSGNATLVITVTSNPVISVESPPSLDFGFVDLGQTRNLSRTVTNTGSGTLSGAATTSGVFSVVSGSPYNLSAGQSTVVFVRYAPTAGDTYDTGTLTLTGGGGATVSLTGRSPFDLTFPAIGGILTSPIVPDSVSSGHYISQTTDTQPSAGGTATYDFDVPAGGDYKLVVSVDAETLTSNSCFLDVDSNPDDSPRVWDCTSLTTPANTFVDRIVGWRGTGTADAPQIPEKHWTLAGGRHRLYVRGREQGMKLAFFTFVALNQAPVVSLTSPADGTFYISSTPVTVNMAATASDLDGTVSKVEFYNGASKVGEDLTAPYAFDWPSVGAGTYSLTAKAIDNGGNSTTSDPPASITVLPPGVPKVIMVRQP